MLWGWGGAAAAAAVDEHQKIRISDIKRALVELAEGRGVFVQPLLGWGETKEENLKVGLTGNQHWCTSRGWRCQEMVPSFLERHLMTWR